MFWLVWVISLRVERLEARQKGRDRPEPCVAKHAGRSTIFCSPSEERRLACSCAPRALCTERSTEVLKSQCTSFDRPMAPHASGGERALSHAPRITSVGAGTHHGDNETQAKRDYQGIVLTVQTAGRAF